MLKNQFRELAYQAGIGNQKQLVDFISEEAPIVAALPMDAASDGHIDKVPVLTSADSVPMAELDGPLVELGSTSRIEESQLKMWQGIMKIGIDQATNSGKSVAELFAKQAEGIIRQSGGDMSLTLYEAFRDYAVRNRVVGGYTDQVIDATGNANTNYSITAVKFVQSDTSGLYNPKFWSNGKIFDVINPYGEQGGLITDVNGNTFAIHARILKLMIGLRLQNYKHVASIVNIDKAANLKTIDIVDKMTRIAQAARNPDVFMMHPEMQRKLGTQVGFDKMEFNDQVRGITTVVPSLNGIPIIADFNLRNGTEANITI